MVQLNNKRIGHGLNAVLFPEVVKAIKDNQMLVEINPWSNKILGYVNDMRNHPGRILLKNQVPCAISNDDPGVFGYDGLAYDFTTIFLAWELDLRDVKRLVFNSITYSALDVRRKKESLEELERRWKVFVTKTNMGLKMSNGH